MKIEYIRSLGLPNGFRVSQYETLKEVLDGTGKTGTAAEADVVAGINKYLRQKSALVAGRDDLAGEIEKLGFAPITKTEKKEGKDVTTWDETEGQFIARFVTSVIKAKFTHPSMTISGTNEEQREASVYAFLQTLANKCGDVDATGKALTEPIAYVLDIKVPERAAGAKKIAQKYIDAATNIINNKSEAKWADKFTKGYKNQQGVQVDPIAFESFVAKPAKDAKPEEVEAVRQSNIKALAKAIDAVEAQVREKTVKTEYA